MSDSDPTIAQIPEAVARPRHRSRLPLAWVIPAVAVLVGGSIAVKAIRDRGPQIEISFETADGIEAGKTKIRYRNVDVGEVRAVTLAPDHHSVVVQAEMAKDTESLLASDTRFWIVIPRIGVGAVSGLGTLLSGSYVGMDIGHASAQSRSFNGMETPPTIASDSPGREYVLRGNTVGSVAVGSPVYFRHVRVGEVTRSQLDDDGGGVTIGIFVQSPYDRFVTDDTRFWHASGVDVDVGADGLRIEVESLATILVGGLAFETPPGSVTSAPAKGDGPFRLAASRELAMRSPNERPVPYILYFEGSLRGLSVGSPVDVNGIEVGEVTSVSVEYDSERVTYRYPVEINVYPQRISARYRVGAETPGIDQGGVDQFVKHLIEHGLRGQLRTGSLLTGQQYVALDFFPHAPPATSDPSKTPMELPTVPRGLDELTGTLADIARRVRAMPLERISAHADDTLIALRETLVSTNRLAEQLQNTTAPEMASTLQQIHKTLGNVDTTLSADGALQQRLQEALRQSTRAAESLRSLAESLDQHPEAVLRGKPKGDQ